MSPEPVQDPDLANEIEWEINDLVAEHGSERAVLHDFNVLLADADRSVSRGYLRGLFSQGARPVRGSE